MTIKVRDVRIRVMPFEQVMQETIEVMWKVKQGKKVIPAKKTISFPDLQTLRSILTDERIRLLTLIQIHQPDSIQQLARLAKRKYANVFTDIKKLKELGLIGITQNKNKTKPKARYNKLTVEIPLTART